MSTFQNPLSVKKNHNNDNITIDYLTKCFLSSLLIFFLFWSSKKCILSIGFGVLLQICKTRENSNFLKNGKIVILVKIRNFSRSRMTKWTSPLELSREI